MPASDQQRDIPGTDADAPNEKRDKASRVGDQTGARQIRRQNDRLRNRTAEEDEEGQENPQQNNGKSPQGKESDEEDNQPKKKPFWKRPILLSVIILIALLLIIGGVIWWLIARNYESTDDAFIDGHIVHIAPRVSGRVLSLNVADNQHVDADTVVITIDPAPYKATLDNAQGMLEQAKAKVAQARADLTVQQANAGEARAAVAVAQADAENADRDYQRYEALPAPARSQQQMDASNARHKSADAQLIEAKKHVASADAQVEESQTAIEAALAQVLAAQGQAEQAALNLGYCNVTAGQAGFVTRRTVEAGNYVQIGQEMMTIVPTDVWVTANFKETQLTFMRPNQPVAITVDAFPHRKYRAHVDSVQTGTGEVFSVLPPENATGNFVKIVQRVPVKIVFDETLDHVLAPGESAEPRVDIRSGR